MSQYIKEDASENRKEKQIYASIPLKYIGGISSHFDERPAKLKYCILKE